MQLQAMMGSLCMKLRTDAPKLILAAMRPSPVSPVQGQALHEVCFKRPRRGAFRPETFNEQVTCRTVLSPQFVCLCLSCYLEIREHCTSRGMSVGLLQEGPPRPAHCVRFEPSLIAPIHSIPSAILGSTYRLPFSCAQGD